MEKRKETGLKGIIDEKVCSTATTNTTSNTLVLVSVIPDFTQNKIQSTWSSSSPLFYSPSSKSNIVNISNSKESKNKKVKFNRRCESSESQNKTKTTTTTASTTSRAVKPPSFDFKTYHCLSLPVKSHKKRIPLDATNPVHRQEEEQRTTEVEKVSESKIDLTQEMSSSTVNMLSKQTSTVSIELIDEETQTISEEIISNVPASLSGGESSATSRQQIDRATSPIVVHPPNTSSSQKYRELERITGHIIIHKFITRSDDELQKLVDLQYPDINYSMSEPFTPMPTTPVPTRADFSPRLPSHQRVIPDSKKTGLENKTERKIPIEVPTKAEPRSDDAIEGSKIVEKSEPTKQEGDRQKDNTKSMLLEQFEEAIFSQDSSTKVSHREVLSETAQNSTGMTEQKVKMEVHSVENEALGEIPQNMPSFPEEIPSQAKLLTETEIFPETQPEGEAHPSHPERKASLITKISEETDEFSYKQLLSTELPPATYQDLDLVAKNIEEEIITNKSQQNDGEEELKSISSMIPLVAQDTYDDIEEIETKDADEEDSESLSSDTYSHYGRDFKNAISKGVKHIATQTDEKSFIRKIIQKDYNIQELPTTTSSAESFNSSSCTNLLEVKLRLEKIDLKVSVAGKKKKRICTTTNSMLPSCSTTNTNSNRHHGGRNNLGDKNNVTELSFDCLEVKGRSIRSHHHHPEQSTSRKSNK